MKHSNLLAAFLLCVFSLVAAIFVSNVFAKTAELPKVATDCHASIDGTTALFLFPIDGLEHFRWGREETKDNDLEYMWQVALWGGETPYSFGFFHWKFSDEKEQSGNFEAFRGSAQLSVFDSKGMLLDSANLLGGRKDGKVAIGVRDKTTYDLLFSDRPTKARFSIYNPDLKSGIRCEAEIEYKEQ